MIVVVVVAEVAATGRQITIVVVVAQVAASRHNQSSKHTIMIRRHKRNVWTACDHAQMNKFCRQMTTNRHNQPSENYPEAQEKR